MSVTDSMNSRQVSPSADGRARRDRRVWPEWVRVSLAVGVVLAFFKVYAGWHWSQRVGSGPGVTFSPTKAYVGLSSALSVVVEFLSEMLGRLPTSMNRTWLPGYWHLAYTLGTVLPAALIGVVVYALLTRWLGPPPPADVHSRCRRCGYILNGLSRPRCPECGEGV